MKIFSTWSSQRGVFKPCLNRTGLPDPEGFTAGRSTHTHYLRWAARRSWGWTSCPGGSRWPATRSGSRPAQRRWEPWCRWSSRRTDPWADRRRSARRTRDTEESSWTSPRSPWRRTPAETQHCWTWDATEGRTASATNWGECTKLMKPVLSNCQKLTSDDSVTVKQSICVKV